MPPPPIGRLTYSARVMWNPVMGSYRAISALAVTVVAVGTIATAAPPASAAPLCAADTFNHALTVTPQSTTGIGLRGDGTYLLVNGSACALLNDVNTVYVDMSPFPSAGLSFDLSGGPLGPGYTNEGNGSSEIEFPVSGFGTGSWLNVTGTTGNDGVKFGQYLDRISGVLSGEVNLNALVDAGSPDNDVSFTAFPDQAYASANSGDDVVSGAGTGTFGSAPFSRSLSLSDGVGVDQVTGGSANDVITGTLVASSPDVWSGGAGTDTLGLVSALGSTSTTTLDDIANDGIGCPGAGCAGANARADFESVTGGGGNETIVGNAGAQLLRGGVGSNVLRGAGGDDTLFANPDASERLLGGGGTDTVNFQMYPPPFGVVVTLDGFPNDGAGGQNSNVGADVEILIGTQSSDFLAGDADANTLIGLIGADDLRGLGGNDTFLPGFGDDHVVGGGDTDTLSFSDLLGPITIDVGARTATGAGSKTFATVERFIGSRAADVFTGGSGNDRFQAGAGDDTLAGGAGDDTLFGQLGDDDFDGGLGTDTCSQGSGSGTVVNCEA